MSQITLPATHDSGARFETVPGTAKCQSATIAEQLNFGVRLLDIRCRHIHDSFAIYHGPVSQNLTFTDVLNDVAAFLTTNPSETVVLSVKEEYTAADNTRSFLATFASHVAANPNIWSRTTDVPAVDAVRGKIVLLRRFGGNSAMGIDASRWPDNTVFLAGNLRVQDWYQVSDNDTKWKHVSEALSSAASDGNPDILHLNFTSGYKPGLFNIPDITSVSGAIHPKLAAHLAATPPGHYGCILLDFADARLCQLIYQKNALPPERPSDR
jgi:1-phosphatidylinositol phosphodiesterase